MIPARTIRPTEQIYSWVRDDGKNYTIATSRLLDWIKAQPPKDIHRQLLPVQQEMVEKFMREKAIHPERIKQLIEGEPATDPVVLCLTGRYDINGVPGPEAMLVDGRHRYTVYALMGFDACPCYVLYPKQWKPFRIIGMQRLTKEQLRDDVPVLNHYIMPGLTKS